MVAAGKNINVTLIFSLQRYARSSRPTSTVSSGSSQTEETRPTVHSVASFFVSRVDTETDKRLDAIGGHAELRGKLGIANAKLAYQHYLEAFASPRWERLARQGSDEATLPLGVDLDQEPGATRT